MADKTQNDQNSDDSAHPITVVANYFRNMYTKSDDSEDTKKKKKVEQEVSPSPAPPAQQALADYFQNLKPRIK